MVKIIIHQNKQQLKEFNSFNPHNQNNQQMISQTTSQEKTQKEQILINRQQNLNSDQRHEEFNQFEEHNLILNNRSTFDFGQQEKKKRQQEEDHQKLQKLMEKSFDDQPVKRSRKNKFHKKIISKEEKQNRKAYLKIQKRCWDGFNRKQQQQSIKTQTQRYVTMESRKPSIREQLVKSPVYGIVAVKDDKFFYHTDQTLVSFVSQSPLVYQRIEIELESKIIGFQVDKANKVIIQTKTHTILYSEDLEKLDSFNDEIEKDLLTYTLKHFKFETLIYFSDQKKQLLKREINNNENTFGKPQILYNCYKPVSIKIIKKSQLFLGFRNGLIELYELQQDRIVLQKKYNINERMEFSQIIFQETQCLGISGKIVLILDYLSKQSQKVLEANENIIQCSHYYNQTKKEYVIHALQQNQVKIDNKIRKFIVSKDMFSVFQFNLSIAHFFQLFRAYQILRCLKNQNCQSNYHILKVQLMVNIKVKNDSYNLKQLVLPFKKVLQSLYTGAKMEIYNNIKLEIFDLQIFFFHYTKILF